MNDLSKVKVGDRVTRMLGGQPMILPVTAVDERFIYCGGEGGWKFDRAFGYEVDEFLGWGEVRDGEIYTGSYLLPSDGEG